MGINVGHPMSNIYAQGVVAINFPWRDDCVSHSHSSTRLGGGLCNKGKIERLKDRENRSCFAKRT